MSLEINAVGDVVRETQEAPTQNGDGQDYHQWQKTEKCLNHKIEALQTELTEEKSKVTLLVDAMKQLEEERDIFKNQVAKLEMQLTKKTLKGSRTEESHDTVQKAKSVIFEKTKLCKNQELQIDALQQQVVALKDIIAINKDLLDIRNLEVKQLQDKMECMELKFTAERDRHELMHTKLDKMITLNAELKCEYQKQLELFTDLQNSYRQKEAALGKIDSIKKNEQN